MDRRILWVAGIAVTISIAGGILIGLQQQDPVPPPKGSAPVKTELARSRPRAVYPPPPTSLDPEKIFRSLLEQDRASRDGSERGCVAFFSGLFNVPGAPIFMKSRLLALSFPNRIEKLASALAIDPQQDLQRRIFCCQILSHLSGRNSALLTGTLRTLSEDREIRIVDIAVSILAERDPDGDFRSLYWGCARRGSRTALYVLSRWPDPDLESKLAPYLAIAENAPLSDSLLRDAAVEVHRQRKLLSAADADERVAALIRTPPKEDLGLYFWALDIVRRHPFEKAREALGRRLEDAETAAGLRKSKRSDWDEELYVSSPNLQHLIPDLFYDANLLAWQEIGGELTVLQERRLYRFGYGGDPGRRLEELLKSDR